MCNRAGGLISRVIESYGVPTINLSINIDFTKKVCPPRSVHIDFPYGAVFGEPGNVDQQMAVIKELFLHLQKAKESGEVSYPPFKWRRTRYSSVKPEDFVPSG